METLGLDFLRHYVNIFVSNDVIDIGRDVSIDKFMFAGAIFQALSITKWRDRSMGGISCLAVEVPDLMIDNALYSIVFSLLNSGFDSIGQGSILFQQAYQPVAEGVPSGPTIFLYKIADQRWGSRRAIRSRARRRRLSRVHHR